MKRILFSLLISLLITGCANEVFPPQLGVSVMGSHSIVITQLPVINNRSGEGPRLIRLPYKVKSGYKGQKSSVSWLGVLNLKGKDIPASLPVSWYLIDQATGLRLNDKSYNQILDMNQVLSSPMGKELKAGKELLIELVFNGDKFRARLTTRGTLDPIWIN